MIRRSSALLTLLLGLTWGSVAVAQEPDATGAFRFSCQTVGGMRIDQDQFRQSVLLVDLWGTWCGPCREAIPGLAELYAKYKHQGFEILGFAFEKGGSDAEQLARVRAFAAEHGITWQLAMGEESIKEQIEGFSGYPTLVLFQRGLRHAKTWTGHSEEIKAEIRKAVETALELTDPAAETAGPAAPAPEPEEVVPEGRIFRPGKSDTGFAFSVEDVDGKTIDFEGFRGGPVLLAITTTWDREASRVAELLGTLSTGSGDLAVLAACFERQRDLAEKIASIKSFRDQKKLDYPMFPADMLFTRKVHRFAALPTLLLFDAAGVLVLREDGMSAETEGRVRAKVTELQRK